MISSIDPDPNALDYGEPFSKFLQLLRGSIRPGITLILAGAITVAFLKILWTVNLPMDVLTGVILGFSNLVSMAVGVWFGGRINGK